MQHVVARGGAETHRSVEEWEQHVGDHIRQIRLAKNLSQARLAHLADVSTGTIHNLESGLGTSLATLIKVLRALGEERWLTELQPSKPPFDPVAAFAQREREQHARRRHASPSTAI